MQAHRAAVSSSGFAAALVVVSSGLSAALAALAALQARGTVARAATAASSHRDNKFPFRYCCVINVCVLLLFVPLFGN